MSIPCVFWCVDGIFFHRYKLQVAPLQLPINNRAARTHVRRFYAGMKVLVLDSVTTQVVAMVYSQSQILEKEVYLVERMDAEHEPMQHLKAVYFIRPTRENIQALCAEIARPRFAEYHVFFCSICPHELLQQLAAADEHEGEQQHSTLNDGTICRHQLGCLCQDASRIELNV